MSEAKAIGGNKSKSKSKVGRKRRLGEQLRANLQRRKARTRGRKADGKPQDPASKDDEGAGEL